MQKINTDKKTLKNFGMIMGAAFLTATLIILARHKHSPTPTIALCLAFFITAGILPRALTPIYIFWMKLAHALSWINTRAILTIVFYLFITPLAVVLRAFGSDLLDKKIDKTKQSYWLPKGQNDKIITSYEKQF